MNISGGVIISVGVFPKMMSVLVGWSVRSMSHQGAIGESQKSNGINSTMIGGCIVTVALRD
jgi:hypothetical protein